MERVALSATVADPDDYRAWLAPDGDIDLVQLVDRRGCGRAGPLKSCCPRAAYLGRGIAANMPFPN